MIEQLVNRVMNLFKLFPTDSQEQTFGSPHKQQDLTILKISQPQEPTSNTSIKAPPTTSKFMELTVNTQSARDKSGSRKRLKLKDYMHLASIEKKNKSQSKKMNRDMSHTRSRTGSVVGNSKFAPGGNQESQLNASKMSQFASQPLKKNTDIIKEEIVDHIEKQMRQLSNLKDYFQNEFYESSEKTETQLMLFSMLNSLKSGSKKYIEIGETIKQREKGKSRRQDRGEYFWEEEKLELSSPAKMLHAGLELTGVAFEELLQKMD